MYWLLHQEKSKHTKSSSNITTNGDIEKNNFPNQDNSLPKEKSEAFSIELTEIVQPKSGVKTIVQEETFNVLLNNGINYKPNIQD